jgi:hypothetical protein
VWWNCFGADAGSVEKTVYYHMEGHFQELQITEEDLKTMEVHPMK